MGPISEDKMNKSQKRRRLRKKSGSILVLVLLVVLVSLITGTGLLALGTQSRVASINQVQDMMSRSAADAGLERAVQEINNAVLAKTWSDSVLPMASDATLPYSESVYSVKTEYDATDGYSIASVGTNKNRTHTVNATLGLRGLFENAIQCRDSITLKAGTVVGTIDSDISLDPADCDDKAVIGTNSTEADKVILNSGVVVEGDVVVGVGGDIATVIKDLGATTDDQYAMSTTVEFPPVSPPSLFGPDSAISINKGEMTIGPGGDFPAVGRFSGISMKNGTTLRVIGDCTLYITGDVGMGQSSEIILDNSKNAKLTIYLDGDWASDNNSGINNETEKPSTFQLYGTGPAGQAIDIKAKSEFYGVIYAPNADLTMFSGGDIYGSFVTNNFELKNPASFLYDVSLKTISVFDEGARFVINRWNEQ
ncbi:MAG: hypothetical protein B6I25_02040 [Planctomycetales bacterium 4572_13]|nr:MAG: hypothetical protein B6I25_02040 [Planctomycetales bacterium 4572_13]